MDNRLARWAAIVASMVMSGCAASYQTHSAYNEIIYQNNKDRLETAVQNRDVHSIAGILNQFSGDPILMGRWKSRFGEHELTHEAYLVMSEQLYQDLVDNEDGAASSAAMFDDLCRRLIRQECSRDARNEVSRREFNRSEVIRAARESRKSQLVSGDAEVASLDDARLVYSPRSGEALLSSPRVNGGDDEYYEFTFFITHRDIDRYISWWPDAHYSYPAQGGVLIDPEFFTEAVFNQPVTVIGRYVGNTEIRLTDLSAAAVPVFKDAMIFGYSL